MSFSTVQQYYTKGPRRLGAAVVSRVDKLTGFGNWLVGDDSGLQIGPKGTTEPGPERLWVSLSLSEKEGPGYPIPVAVAWRVKRVTEKMAAESGIDVVAAHRIMFASILKGLKEGFFGPANAPPALPATVGGRRFDLSATDAAAVVGMDLRRAKRQIHRLCEFWETELNMPALPSIKKSKTAKKTATKRR